MISVAALVIVLASIAVGEGVVLMYEPPTPATILGALVGIGLGSGLVVVGTAWWLMGNPPNVLPADTLERIACRWEFGPRFCFEMMGPPKW